jgi:ribonuclease H2 subunit A
VTPKADSKFKIVGAASVAAKVTRDAWVDGWLYAEDVPAAAGEAPAAAGESPAPRLWADALGSGYPSDPRTQAWLRASLERTFGFPAVVRFSWTTVKVLLDKDAHAVTWCAPAPSAFAGVG